VCGASPRTTAEIGAGIGYFVSTAAACPRCWKPSPCTGHGVCLFNSTLNHDVCNCTTPYWDGATCAHNWDPNACANFGCENNATCTATSASTYCTCPAGYIGTKCAFNGTTGLPINSATPAPPVACRWGDVSNRCWNGATCVTSLTGDSCLCAPGFAGPLCDIRTADNSTLRILTEASSAVSNVWNCTRFQDHLTTIAHLCECPGWQVAGILACANYFCTFDGVCKATGYDLIGTCATSPLTSVGDLTTIGLVGGLQAQCDAGSSTGDDDGFDFDAAPRLGAATLVIGALSIASALALRM